MAKTERRALTPKEQRRAQVFRNAWLAKKAAERISQGDAGEALDMSPSAFGQYINAKIPINLEAGLALCEYLSVDPVDAELDVPIKAKVSMPSLLGAPRAKAEVREAEMRAMLESLNDEQLVSYLAILADSLPGVDQVRLAETILRNARKTL